MLGGDLERILLPLGLTEEVDAHSAMTRNLPSLNALRAFEAAARRLSFRLAAEELCLTPSAISRHIRMLEDTLGVRLFERGYQKVRLTGAGESYAAALAGVFDRIASATAEVSGRGAAAVTKPLVICVYPAFGLRWLASRWAQFVVEHPQLHARFFTTTRLPDCYSDRCDAAIWFGGTPPPDHRSVRLAHADISPLCVPSLCEQPGRPLHRVRDLRRHTLFHSNLRALDWSLWLTAAVASGEATSEDVSAIDPDRGIKLENTNLAYQAALAGHGVAIGFNLLAADEIAAGRLVRPFGTVRRSRRSFWLICRNESRPDRRIETFRAWIEKEIAVSTALCAQARTAVPHRG